MKKVKSQSINQTFFEQNISSWEKKTIKQECLGEEELHIHTTQYK